MLNKSSSKVLLIILIVLAGLFFILRYTDRTEQTIREHLVSVDTARIDNILIRLPRHGGSVELKKDGSNWKVKEGSRNYNADNRKVRQVIGQISELVPKSIAARSHKQWGKYQVTDSLGTRLQMKEGDKVEADVVLGRISFRAPKKQNQNPYMQQQQTEILMYARPYDDNSVYVVDGMVKLGMGNNPDDFRQKLFCRIKPGDIKSLTFSYQGEPTFTLQGENNKWVLDGQPVDSAATAKYIHNFSYAQGAKFVNGFNPSGQVPSGKISIELNGQQPVVLTAYKVDSTHTVVHSTLNEESYFNGQSGKIFEKFFVKKDHFSPGNKTK